jgi:hypothetical protein
LCERGAAIGPLVWRGANEKQTAKHIMMMYPQTHTKAKRRRDAKHPLMYQKVLGLVHGSTKHVLCCWAHQHLSRALHLLCFSLSCCWLRELWQRLRQLEH